MSHQAPGSLKDADAAHGGRRSRPPAARAFLDAVVESVPAMLVVKNGKDGRFVLVNRAGEALLGVPRATLIGRGQ